MIHRTDLKESATIWITVDLNSLLYKYEVNSTFALFEYLGMRIAGLDGKKPNSQFWLGLAEKRKENITKYLWNEESSNLQ